MAIHLSKLLHPNPAKSARNLSYLLGIAGILHFLAPRPFDAIVPPQLPGKSRSYTYFSGLVELALSAGFNLQKTRATTGIISALFFIAVFPANIYMYRSAAKNPKNTKIYVLITLLRLPLQIPLIYWALLVNKNSHPAALSISRNIPNV